MARHRSLIRTVLLLTGVFGIQLQANARGETSGGRGVVVFDRSYAAAQNAFWSLQRRLAAKAAPSSKAAPTITSGSILTPVVDVSKNKAHFELSLTFNAQGQYAASLVTLASPSGELYFVGGQPLPPGTTSGTVGAGSPSAFEGAAVEGAGVSVETINELPGYLQPGAYTVTAATIMDYAGQTTNYTASQVAALFNGNVITVVNHGTPDYSAPSITSARILTKRVSRSASLPYVVVEVDATDDYSGIAELEVVAMTGAPGGGLPTTGYAPIPFTKGSLKTFAQITPDLPVGTYAVEQVVACDAAGNCALDANPSDISSFFGGHTTFDVVD